MSYALRYYGTFGGQEKDTWRIEIWQEGYSGTHEEVTLSGNPLTITWSHADKYDSLQPSSATLELLSNEDRRFLDMYTVKAGNIRLDVLLNGTTYWSGTLDTELYEEPYYREKNYYVSLTFSDFAILSRKKWSTKGFITLQEVINTCVEAMQIKYSVVETYLSTQLGEGSTGNILEQVSVNSMNYFDEDDSAMTLQKVLDSTLQPLAMRIIQKNGKIHIYDINSIHGTFTPETVQWRNANSILSQDKVYNNVKVTFSPYGASTVADAEVDEYTVEGGKMYGYTVTPADVATPGFNLTVTDQGDGDMVLGSIYCKYYKIESQFSGSDGVGVAQLVNWINPDGSTESVVNDPIITSNWVAQLKEPVFISKVTNDYMLRLSVDMLVDGRYNPFEPWEEGENDRSNGYFQNDVKIFWQRCQLSIRTDKEAANPDYVYSNRSIWDSNNLSGNAEWKKWETSQQGEDDMSICYYEFDRNNTCAMGEWKTNKQCIGNYYGDLPSLYEKRGNGEFISLPPIAGWINFRINNDCRAKNKDGSAVGNNSMKRFWHLIRSIRIEVVDPVTMQVIPQEDEETTAWLNKNAQEELPIDTIVGTMEKPSPVAKGQLFRSSDYSVISTLSRGGITDRVEKLLIGTIYSNYATRHPMLSGDVVLLKNFGVLTDKWIPEKYITLEETQDLKRGISTISMVKIDPDNYKGE